MGAALGPAKHGTWHSKYIKEKEERERIKNNERMKEQGAPSRELLDGDGAGIGRAGGLMHLGQGLGARGGAAVQARLPQHVSNLLEQRARSSGSSSSGGGSSSKQGEGVQRNELCI